jgi:predicted protein tyrosine phosphatase
VDSRVPVPAIIAVIAGAAAVAWLLRRFSPGMRPSRRLLWVAIGGLVAGGFLYKAVLNQ